MDDRQCEICGTLHQDLAMNDIGGLTVCDYCEEAALAASETASAAPTPGEDDALDPPTPTHGEG